MMRCGTPGGGALEVSRTGLGCNNFGGGRPRVSNAPVGRMGLDSSPTVLYAALDAGITFLDTADFYGNRGGVNNILAFWGEGTFAWVPLTNTWRERLVIVKIIGPEINLDTPRIAPYGAAKGGR